MKSIFFSGPAKDRDVGPRATVQGVLSVGGRGQRMREVEYAGSAIYEHVA